MRLYGKYRISYVEYIDFSQGNACKRADNPGKCIQKRRLAKSTSCPNKESGGGGGSWGGWLRFLCPIHH